VPRQVKIDIKVTEGIRAEQTVEWCREHPRHFYWRHKDTTPRYCDLSGSKAPQFDFMSWKIARNPAKVPLKFDGWSLRTDPLGDIGSQDRSFGPGIQN
jgi:hypothetical protein